MPQVVPPESMDLGDDVALPTGLSALAYREAKEQALAAFEHHYFTALRDRTGANVSEAARQEGLDRSNVRRAIKRAGVSWRDEAESA
jgi:DNA-binding NtrC family response regulator